MAEQTPSPPAQSSDRDRTQDKADILESNLFQEISKQANPVIVRFQVDRTKTPDQVIVKALGQLFPRINLNSPKIPLLIRKLLVRKIPDGEELKIQKQLLNLSSMGNPDLAHLAVFMRVLVTRDLLAVEIKGVPPVPSRDAEIGKAFFDYKRCPGAVSDDGKIDFREINKYPIVKKGDNLFFITPEVQGKPGIQYDGKVIHVPQALPMDVATRDGVDIVESQKTGGKSRGYFLRAARTGVVLLSLANGKVRKIEIRDALDIRRIDYSTGNIGTNFICPISMKIDTICSGFSIRARGTVEVGELEGGTVETDSHAKITMSLFYPFLNIFMADLSRRFLILRASTILDCHPSNADDNSRLLIFARHLAIFSLFFFRFFVKSTHAHKLPATARSFHFVTTRDTRTRFITRSRLVSYHV